MESRHLLSFHHFPCLSDWRRLSDWLTDCDPWLLHSLIRLASDEKKERKGEKREEIDWWSSRLAVVVDRPLKRTKICLLLLLLFNGRPTFYLHFCYFHCYSLFSNSTVMKKIYWTRRNTTSTFSTNDSGAHQLHHIASLKGETFRMISSTSLRLFVIVVAKVRSFFCQTVSKKSEWMKRGKEGLLFTKKYPFHSQNSKAFFLTVCQPKTLRSRSHFYHHHHHHLM